MKKIIFILCLMFSNLLSHHVMDNQKIMITYAEDWAPYSYRDENGNMQGILVEIANELLRNKLHLDVRNEGFPWKRAQKLAEEGTFDAVITYPSENRKKKYLYAKEPLTNLEWRGFSSKYSKNYVSTMASKDPLSIKDKELAFCAVLGDETSFGLLKNANGKVHKAKNVDIAIKHLNKGRSDFFINSRLTTMHTIYRNGIVDDVQIHSKIYKQVPFHFLLSKKSDFDKRVITRLDKLVVKMKKDGSYKKMIQDIELSELQKIKQKNKKEK